MAPNNKDLTAQQQKQQQQQPGQKTKEFEWKEIIEHRSRDDLWLVVNGKVYDVTNWVPNHPGGEIILTGGGRESTAMFYSYHPSKVIRMIDKYYIGDVANYQTYYKYDSEFYTTLKSRVDKYMSENKLTRNSPLMFFKSLLILFLWGLFYYYGMLKGSILCVIMLGVCHSQLGINIMHDGNHGSFSNSKILCWLAGFVMDLMGASSIVWLHQHNIGHHPNCNNTDDPSKTSERLNPDAFDPDASSGSPFIRLNPKQPRLWYHRYQHIYLWILISFILFKWTINDVRSVLKRKYNVVRFYELSQMEVVRLFLTKAFFFLYILVIPLQFLPTTQALGLFLIFMGVTGYSFVFMFSVNHLTDETTFPDSTMEERDWAILQVMTSSNFAIHSPFWSWLSGGLNFQIEHHLFPGINHTHLRRIAPIVQKTCQEYGIRYIHYSSFWTALYSHFKHVKLMGQNDTVDRAHSALQSSKTPKSTKSKSKAA